MNKSRRGDYGNAPNTQPQSVPKKPVSGQPPLKPGPKLKKR
jgi:hypothetical protein